MKSELNAKAVKNFNERAQALLAKAAPATGQGPSNFPTHMSRPGAHSHQLSDEDILDFKLIGLQDQLGQATARFFEHEGQRFALEGEQYEELARLSKAIQKTPALRDIVSTRWVEDVIVDWMRAKKAGADAPELTDFLAKRGDEDVKEHVFWFPVANLSVESDLSFGNVVFKTISKEMLDRLEEDSQKAKEQGIKSGLGEEAVAQYDRLVERMRHDLQGLAASTIMVNAEPQRASEVALRESERAVATLGLYHVGAATMPEVGSYCALLGRDNVETIRYLKVENERIRGDSQKVAHEPVLHWLLSGEDQQGTHKPVLHWHLSDEDVSRYKERYGFDNVSELLALERRTDFQEALLNALLLYWMSSREKHLPVRLVYMLVAIESVLVKDGNEPIQQNVGERMAFMITNNAEKRKGTIRNLKDAYNLRSKFVHHGHPIDDLDTIRTFMINAWALFLELAKDIRRFDTKEQLFDHLETIKLS